MANLTTSGVTLHRAWYNGLQRNVQCKDVTLVLAAMGTTTNQIPATALGFTKLLGPVTLIKDNDTEILLGVPSYDNTLLLLQGVTVTEDSGNYTAVSEPVDATGTYRGVITGI